MRLPAADSPGGMSSPRAPAEPRGAWAAPRSRTPSPPGRAEVLPAATRRTFLKAGAQQSRANKEKMLSFFNTEDEDSGQNFDQVIMTAILSDCDETLDAIAGLIEQQATRTLLGVGASSLMFPGLGGGSSIWAADGGDIDEEQGWKVAF